MNHLAVYDVYGYAAYWTLGEYWEVYDHYHPDYQPAYDAFETEEKAKAYILKNNRQIREKFSQ